MSLVITTKIKAAEKVYFPVQLWKQENKNRRQHFETPDRDEKMGGLSGIVSREEKAEARICFQASIEPNCRHGGPTLAFPNAQGEMWTDRVLLFQKALTLMDNGNDFSIFVL
ncbi:hypothetical protein V6N13_137988 [Hibiscus sabdariffa]|uniref:Uncharacterized protein n=1 Tax=Hibiscus sabdariffa TaxID=183260 RepID=A0ABR2QC68_9ROSI